jgi:hypothetical protein
MILRRRLPPCDKKFAELRAFGSQIFANFSQLAGFTQKAAEFANSAALICEVL